jgi:hypothetical protein
MARPLSKCEPVTGFEKLEMPEMNHAVHSANERFSTHLEIPDRMLDCGPPNASNVSAYPVQ